jgi:hypothetical protein
LLEGWQRWVHLPVAVTLTATVLLLHGISPDAELLLAGYYVGAAMHTTIAWTTAIRQSRRERERFRREVEEEVLPNVRAQIAEDAARAAAAGEARFEARVDGLEAKLAQRVDSLEASSSAASRAVAASTDRAREELRAELGRVAEAVQAQVAEVRADLGGRLPGDLAQRLDVLRGVEERVGGIEQRVTTNVTKFLEEMEHRLRALRASEVAEVKAALRQEAQAALRDPSVMSNPQLAQRARGLNLELLPKSMRNSKFFQLAQAIGVVPAPGQTARDAGMATTSALPPKASSPMPGAPAPPGSEITLTVKPSTAPLPPSPG